MDLIEEYLLSLAPPKRLVTSSPKILEGKEDFYDFKCHSCHHPKYVTRADYPKSELRFQLIWPYSDFLLHDMGGGLSDVNGTSEWRTPPLWGLSYAKIVNPSALFLHDGRARTIEEAILWHDGEAKISRQLFISASSNSRKALIEFINSL